MVNTQCGKTKILFTLWKNYVKTTSNVIQQLMHKANWFHVFFSRNIVRVNFCKIHTVQYFSNTFPFFPATKMHSQSLLPSSNTNNQLSIKVLRNWNTFPTFNSIFLLLLTTSRLNYLDSGFTVFPNSIWAKTSSSYITKLFD